MYQFCYDHTLKRGDIKKLSSDTQKGTTDLTWENIQIISAPHEDDIDWWGLVENDELALELTGTIFIIFL